MAATFCRHCGEAIQSHPGQFHWVHANTQSQGCGPRTWAEPRSTIPEVPPAVKLLRQRVDREIGGVQETMRALKVENADLFNKVRELERGSYMPHHTHAAHPGLLDVVNRLANIVQAIEARVTEPSPYRQARFTDELARLRKDIEILEGSK